MFLELLKKFVFSVRAGSLVKRITWLSMVAISISVAAFLIVLFVMNGMNDNIEKRILAIEPHIVIEAKNRGEEKFLVDEKLQAFLKENTRNFNIYDTQDIIIRTFDGQFRGAVARGVSHDSLAHLNQQVTDMQLRRGGVNAPKWSASDLPQEGEILVGIDLARSLNLLEGDFVALITPESLLMAPGESPKVERVRVRKIISTELQDIDAQNLFYQRGYALNLFSSALSRKAGLEIWLDEGKEAESAKRRIEKLTPLKVETWMDRNSVMFFALRLEKIMIGIFLGLAGLIAGSSILTVLTLLISEKQRDIAILKTLGLSSKKAVQVFTQIGFSIAGVGVLTGSIVGLLVSIYIQHHPIVFDRDIYYDPEIPARVSWWLFFCVLIFSSALAWIGSLLPAKTAEEIQPSHALKMKN